MIRLHAINTGFFKLDGGAMFGVVPKTIWSKTNIPDELNLVPLAMRSLLIVEGDRRILIDTGIGNKQDDKFLRHYHLHGTDSTDRSLAKHGFTKDDITDVFLTHLHLDHAGGAIEKHGDQFVPAFKNAHYWSSEAQWKWAMNANDREKASFLKENLLPIQESGKLRFVDSGNHFPSKNIEIRTVNGHTRGMIIPLINYHNRIIACVADLIPTAGHVPVPYVAGYDVFPLTAMDEKKAFLLEALEKSYILFMTHDPEHECFTLKETDKGIRPDAFISISDLDYFIERNT